MAHPSQTHDRKMTAQRHAMPAGGGAFALPRLSMGLFLVDQPTHRLGVGVDRSRHVPLQAGQGWILPAGASGLCEYDTQLDVLMVEVPASLVADIGVRDGADFRPLVGALDPLLVQLAHAAAADGGSALYAETMQLAFAAHLARVLEPATPWSDATDDRRLQRALDYIHDNLATGLTLDAMASEAAMSRFHFARAFARAIGLSPLQYVIRERMKQAQLLLRTTRLPVAAIAVKVGYEDLSRFGQHFRRHAGATPAAYRDAV